MARAAVVVVVVLAVAVVGWGQPSYGHAYSSSYFANCIWSYPPLPPERCWRCGWLAAPAAAVRSGVFAGDT